MGVAALVLGIISIILSFIPFCGWFTFLLPLTGLGLAIGELITKGKQELPKGMGIAGLVLNIIALIVMTVMLLIIGALIGGIADQLEDFTYFVTILF